MRITAKVRIGESVVAKLAARVPEAARHAVLSAQQWTTGEWGRLAGQKLTRTHMQYVDGLAHPESATPVEVQRGVVRASVVLVGAFPNMLESGAGAFDIKPGLLRSSKVKVGKSGRYIDVPFRHLMSGVGVSTLGTPLPKEMVSVARRIPRGRRIDDADIPVGGRWGQRSKLPVGAVTSPDTWKASPYAGMVHAGAPRHGRRLTFRRVSTRSDPSSWWHPGLRAINIAPEAARAAERVMADFLRAEAVRAMRFGE